MSHSPNKDAAPNFEAALTSFKYYKSVDSIPRAVFRRTQWLMRESGVQLDDACAKIAGVIMEDQIERGICEVDKEFAEDTLQGLRDRVRQRLMEGRPSQPSSPFAVSEAISPEKLAKALKAWR